MKTKSIKGKSTEQIKIELDKSMEDGFAPTLAIVFLSVSQDRAGNININGMTSPPRREVCDVHRRRRTATRPDSCASLGVTYLPWGAVTSGAVAEYARCNRHMR